MTQKFHFWVAKENENTNLRKSMHPYVLWIFICHNQDVETTPVPINNWVDKEDEVYMHNETLLIHKREWSFAICGNMDVSRGQYAKMKCRWKTNTAWFL